MKGERLIKGRTIMSVKNMIGHLKATLDDGTTIEISDIRVPYKSYQKRRASDYKPWKRERDRFGGFK